MGREYVESHREYDQSYWGKPLSPDLLAGLRSGEKFSDSEFPPTRASLYYDFKTAKGFESPATAEWKRLGDLFPKAELFKGDGRGKQIGASDILQGALGDCWLMSAMSIVATRPDLLENIIVEAHPEEGMYEFRFFKEEKWVNVVVDDFVPVTDHDAVLLARSNDAGECWVPMLEKAYAKLHGHYQCLNGGATVYALVDMTGGAAESLVVSASKNAHLLQNSGEKLLTKLRQCKGEGWLVGCSFKSTGGQIHGKVETTAAQGLIGGHAYALLDLKQVYHRGYKTWIVRLRNPWGQSEWTGPWSDRSREWTREILDEVNYSFANDGTFWMGFQDFQRYVDTMDVCRTYRNTLGEPFRYLTHDSEWSRAERNAGGANSMDNPQYIVQSSVETPIYVTLSMDDDMYLKKDRGCLDYDQKAVGFWIFRSNRDERLEGRIRRSMLYCPAASHERARTVAKEVLLKRGESVVIMPTQYAAGLESRYRLSIFAVDKVKMMYTTENRRNGDWMSCSELAVSLRTKRMVKESNTSLRHEAVDMVEVSERDNEELRADLVQKKAFDEKEAAEAIKQTKQAKIRECLDFIMPRLSDVEEPVNLDEIVAIMEKARDWVKQLEIEKQSRSTTMTKSGKRLGADQVAKIRDQFRKYDKDRSNTIDTREFQNIMNDLGHRVTWSQASQWLAQLDPDQSGKLDFGEFLDWYGG